MRHVGRLAVLITFALLVCVPSASPRASLAQESPPRPKGDPPSKKVVIDLPDSTYAWVVASPGNNSGFDDDLVRRAIAFRVVAKYPDFTPTQQQTQVNRAWDSFRQMRECAGNPAKCGPGDWENAAAEFKKISDHFAPVIELVPGASKGVKIFNAIAKQAGPEFDKFQRFVNSEQAKEYVREVRLNAQAEIVGLASAHDMKVRAEGDRFGRTHQSDDRVIRPLVGFPAGLPDRDVVAEMVDRVPPSQQAKIKKIADDHKNARNKQDLCRDIRGCAHELYRECFSEARSLVPGEPGEPGQAQRSQAAAEQDRQKTKQALDDIGQAARALGALARLIDPSVAKEVEAVAIFVAETAAAVGTYIAAGAAIGNVPGLVIGIALAAIHLIANLTAGEDPSVTLLREFREAIREVFERFDRVDAEFVRLRKDLFDKLQTIENLILKEGEVRRAEAADILRAVEKVDQKLDRRFDHLLATLEALRQRAIVVKVNGVLDPTGKMAPDERNKRIRDIADELREPSKELAGSPERAGDKKPFRSPHPYPWRNVGEATKAVAAAAGFDLTPDLGQATDVVDLQFRVGEYARLLEGAPDAYGVLNPDVTARFLDDTRKLANALSRQIDRKDGWTVIPPPGSADPVLEALLAKVYEKRSRVPELLAKDRDEYAAKHTAGLDPFGTARQGTGADDGGLIPERVTMAEGAKWSYESASDAPPRNLPALPLLTTGERSKIAAKLDPAVRNALRLGLLEAAIEWTGGSWGGGPDHAVNSGDLVVTRHRKSIGIPSGIGNNLFGQLDFDDLYFHGRLTLNVRFTIKPKDPKAALWGGKPPPPLDYYDRIVTPPSEVMGFGVFRGVTQPRVAATLKQVPKVGPRLSMDLEAIRLGKGKEPAPAQFDDPPKELWLPGDRRLAKWMRDEFPAAFARNPNAFTDRFAESPDRDLLTDEAAVIRDDGYAAAGAQRLFPSAKTEEQRGILFRQLVESRRTPSEFKFLRGTNLYRDRDGKELPRRDAALRSLIDSRTDSDIAGHWVGRAANEIRGRAVIDALAAAAVQATLRAAAEELIDAQTKRLADEAHPLGNANRELSKLCELVDTHIQLRYPRTSAAVPAVAALLERLCERAPPRPRNFVGPEEDPVYTLRQVFVDRSAEVQPALDAAIVRLGRHALVHRAVR